MFLGTDVVVTEDKQYLTRWFTEQLRGYRQSGSVISHSKLLVVPTDNSLEMMSDTSVATNYAKYILASAKLTQHFVDNAPEILSKALAAGDQRFTVKHANLSVYLRANQVPSDAVWLKRETVLSVFGSMLDPHPEYPGRWRIVDTFTPSFEGNLAEAYKRARSAVLHQSIYGADGFSLDTTLRLDERVSFDTVLPLSKTYKILSSHVKLDFDVVRDARNELLREQARAGNTAQNIAKATSREKFLTYWGAIKNDMQRRVFPSEVSASWDAIPVPVTGTNTSRTWGIEVETVQAQLVSRPAGWEAKSDGSLESLDGDDCECDCSDCYDGYHENCEDGSSCMEFVSPVLSHFHSNGLKALCGPLEHARKNETPGIHVHVGADDLTIMDVGRLVRAYSLVSPFLEPISHRETRGYCKDVSSDNLAYWLSAVRKTMRGELTNRYGNNECLSPTDIVQAAYYQPDDRYHDLNLMALTAHGTIEFRVMGPHYNYNHLIKWAWFCREMVNVARLDLPSSVWSSVRSMADVISVLRTYGSELPSDDPDKQVVALTNVLNDIEPVEV